MHEGCNVGSGSDGSNTSTPSPSHYSGPPSTSASTWSNWPDPPHVQAKPDPTGLPFDRPHTISTAYERHTRPALTAQTFEPPDSTQLLDPQSQSQQLAQTPQSRPSSQTAPSTPSLYAVPSLVIGGSMYQQPQQIQVQQQMQQLQKEVSPYAVPCIVPPQRRDSRPASMVGDGGGGSGAGGGSPHRAPPPAPGPKPRVKPVAPPTVPDFSNSAPDQSKKKNGKVEFSPDNVNWFADAASLGTALMLPPAVRGHRLLSRCWLLVGRQPLGSLGGSAQMNTFIPSTLNMNTTAGVESCLICPCYRRCRAGHYNPFILSHLVRNILDFSPSIQFYTRPSLTPPLYNKGAFRLIQICMQELILDI